MPLRSKDLERSCGNGSSRRRPLEAMLSREPLEKEDTPNICTFLRNCYERYKITLFPNLTEIIRSKFLELPNQANKCCTQSSPSPLQISCPLWYRRLVEIHQPITTCKCKGRRDEQRKTKWRLAGGQSGRASRVLLSVFKLESSSSAWEDPKLPIVRNPSRFCPSAWLPAHGTSGMLSQRALGLTWSNRAYVQKLGHPLGSLCCSDTSWKSHTAVTGLAERYFRRPAPYSVDEMDPHTCR